MSCITHNTFGKPLLENVFRQWQTQLSATWADKVRDRQALTFALVHPEPEDIAVGVLAQIIVTEGAVADSRSNVISVYDSDPDMERSPYTLAMVLPRRLNLAGLLSVLHLQAECPPHALENLCSLWIGRIPIGSNHEVNVFMRNAFRLILSRGIRLDVPYLLTLDNAQLRRILQRAIRSEVFDRPPEPNFVNVLATTADLPSDSGGVAQVMDNRPSWIPIVERHFQRRHQREPPDYNPILRVQVWYLNNNFDHVKQKSLMNHSCGERISSSNGVTGL